MTEDGYRLIEVDNLLTIYADCIATARPCGPNAKIIYAEKRFWGGELVLFPVVQMIRPATSYVPGLVAKLVAESRDQHVRASLMAH